MTLDKVTEQTLFDLADLFKVFGDSTRIRILHRLILGPTNVSDIAEHLNMSQSAISHQLRYLKKADLIKSKRDGKNNIYSLADDHVRIIFSAGLEHIEEEEYFTQK